MTTAPRTRPALGSTRLRALLLGVAGILFMSGPAPAQDADPGSAPSGPTQAAKEGLGAAVCLTCHENDKVMGILETPHADVEDLDTPAAKERCESCHGPSATHMEFPMQVGNIVFTKHGKTPIRDRNGSCLACHEKGAREHWDEGAHGEELACNSCHVIHRPKDPTLAKTGQAERCGRVAPEDVLYAVNGVAVRKGASARQIVLQLSRPACNAGN